MSRRRDRRRFGRGSYVIGLRQDLQRWGGGFPFDVPAVAAVEGLRLDAPVTLLAGDNGTGKSTLVEAIAEAMGFFNIASFVDSRGTFAPDLSLYGEVLCTSSRTASRSSRSPPTAAPARACTSSTSRRRRSP